MKLRWRYQTGDVILGGRKKKKSDKPHARTHLFVLGRQGRAVEAEKASIPPPRAVRPIPGHWPGYSRWFFIVRQRVFGVSPPGGQPRKARLRHEATGENGT